VQSFSELSLSAPVSRAITEMGYEKPSPIQAETLPILLGESTDFLGLAATGTGKTAAFAIPMIERLDSNVRRVQSLILCPTRELALQVCDQVAQLGKFKGVRPVAIYGGSSYADQIHGIKSGATVVVGTPGRIVDHIERGTLRLDDLKTLILDEADEMISMGFKEDLEKILSAAPRDLSKLAANVETSEMCNIWLFSATMSREVRRVADTYLRAPKQVQINRTEMVPPTIEQYYYPTSEANKAEILCKLMETSDEFYGLVFCQTKALVIDLTQYLHERGYKVDCLHGDKDQNSRERTMQSFRDRKVTVLICTDVAARGLDVKDITHVINYSLPRELDNYVHRIGRTGRSGKTGIAMNLVTQSHRRLIFQIENMTKTRMMEGQIPTRREIGARKVTKQLATFTEQAFFPRALEVMSDEWKTALAAMTPEEVAGRFLTMMMPDVFIDSQRAERPARQAEAPSRSSAYSGAGSSSGFGPRGGSERRFDSKPAARPASRPGYTGPSASAESTSPSAPRSFDRSPKPFSKPFEKRTSVSAPSAPVAAEEGSRYNRTPTRSFDDAPSTFGVQRSGPRAISSVTGPASGPVGGTSVPKKVAPKSSAFSDAVMSSPDGQTLNRKARRALKFGQPFNEPGDARQAE
jgi:ATP-dependent RNA helicase DeaD